MVVTEQHLLIDTPQAGVCRLRLNRPGVFNALSRELVVSMRDAVKRAYNDGAGVLILTGAGRGFCAGADLKERKTMTDSEKYAHNRAISALANEIAAAPFPTIAAVNGVALGGGTELALACDMRFAVESATLGLTEARVGAMPGAGGSQRLPRLIGTGRALEMIFSGDPVTAAKAADWGLVNALVEPNGLDEYVLALAGRLAARSRRSAALLKHAVYAGLDASLADGLEIERLAIVEVLASGDYKEGLAAFAERRQPVFNDVDRTDYG